MGEFKAGFKTDESVVQENPDPYIFSLPRYDRQERINNPVTTTSPSQLAAVPVNKNDYYFSSWNFEFECFFFCGPLSFRHNILVLCYIKYISKMNLMVRLQSWSFELLVVRHSLPLLSGPLLNGVIIRVRVSSLGQIGLFNPLKEIIIINLKTYGSVQIIHIT